MPACRQASKGAFQAMTIATVHVVKLSQITRDAANSSECLSRCRSSRASKRAGTAYNRGYKHGSKIFVNAAFD